MMLNCVVIDDEPLARECLEGYISDIGFLNLTASANNPLELHTILQQHEIHLILLDIQMPVMNGIEFLKIATKRPMVIITSAYPEYALDGFQLDVLDYLVKPIVFSRFFKAVSKARDYQLMLTPAGSPAPAADAETFCFIKCDYRYEKIYFDDILFVEALQNYVTIYTTKGKFLTLIYLKSIEERLDKQRFLRVHKSYLIAIPKVKAIENNEILIAEFRIPISRNYREEVIDRIVDNRLWKK